MVRLIVLLSIALTLGTAYGICAEPSFLSTTGQLLTPDDSVLGAGDFSSDYHGISFDDAIPNVLGANIGVNGNLELGVARLDPDMAGASIKTLLNGKYLGVAETAYRPSVVFGCADITGSLSADDDPSFYVVVGKNLTPLATCTTGKPSAPLRGYVGYGMGIYDGVFAGLSWNLGPRVKLMGEYINGLSVEDTFQEDSMLNAGVQFYVVEGLTAQVAVFGGQDIGFGVNYVKLGF